MSSDKNTSDKPIRKPYEKPRIRVIELAADEVLAVGCKHLSSGTAFGQATRCTLPRVCYNPGS